MYRYVFNYKDNINWRLWKKVVLTRDKGIIVKQTSATLFINVPTQFQRMMHIVPIYTLSLAVPMLQNWVSYLSNPLAKFFFFKLL